jgi:hypothetical protein
MNYTDMDNKSKLPFNRINYKWMLIGLAFLAVGFILMALDSEEFGFGFLGLTLGPLVVTAGFLIEIVAILKAPEKKDS